MGKLNMWQWLGVILLIIGVALYINRNMGEKPKQGPIQNAPVTQPAPTVATQPA